MNTPSLASLLLAIAHNATSLTPDGRDGYRATMPGTPESVGIGEFDITIPRRCFEWTPRVSVRVDGHTYWDGDVRPAELQDVARAWRVLDHKILGEQDDLRESVVRQFGEALTDLPDLPE